MKEKNWIQSNDIEFLHALFKHRIISINVENTNLFHILMNFFDSDIIVHYVDENKMTILDNIFSINEYYDALNENELDLFINYLENHHFDFTTNFSENEDYSYLVNVIRFRFYGLIRRFMKLGLTIPTVKITNYETKKTTTSNYLILFFCNTFKERSNIEHYSCYSINMCQVISFCISLGLFDTTTTDSDGKTLRYYVNENRQFGTKILGEDYELFTKTF